MGELEMEWRSKGGAPQDRGSARVAEEIVKQIVPDEEFRRFALDVLAELIDAATAGGAASWSITLFNRRVRLNVGWSWVFDIGVNVVRVATKKDGLDPQIQEQLQDRLGAWRTGAEWVQLGPGHAHLWPQLRDAALERIREIGATRSRYAQTHSPGFVRYLEEVTGRTYDDRWQIEQIPAAHGELVLLAGKKDELSALLHEFANTYDISEHVARARETRDVGRANYERALTHGLFDARGLDLVFRGLMPHASDSNGGWVSIAPAVAGDIRVWFEASGWVAKDQWPEIARAVMQFLQEADDGDLEGACARFDSRPIKGFQGGMVTPILNALDPKRFLIVNRKPVDMLNYFTNSSATTELRDYPVVNRQLRQFAEVCVELAPDLLALRGVAPSELTDTFSHWLRAEKGLALKRPDVRYLKVSPGRKGEIWWECLQKHCIAIAWDDLGDLSGMSRSDFKARIEEVLQDHPDWKKTDLWQVWQVARLRVGDCVVANDGTKKVLGFGTVTGDYYFDSSAADHHHRLPVDWDDTIARRVDRGGWRRTVIKLDEEEWNALKASPEVLDEVVIEPDLTEVSEVIDNEAEGAPSIPRNVILYGPPGTGKTYITARRSVELCLGPEEKLEQGEVNDQFRKLRSGGSIEFVTFHQSYGYEEFVEGIRPAMDSDEASEVQYRYESGIFKRIALRAAAEGVKTQQVEPPFETLWAELLVQIAQAEEDGELFITAAPNKREYALFATSQGNIRAHHIKRGEDGEPILQEKYLQGLKKYGQAIWKHRAELGKDLEDYSYQRVTEVVAQELGTGGGCHGNIVWLAHVRMLSIADAHSGTPTGDLDTVGRAALLQEYLRTGRTDQLNYDGAKQYVLVIDEINRGNISKILGELITLLEPSKRLTMADELVLQLPYTKEQFGVPPNLHVIGTMNTADRSIALMDVALRRRFEFEEMMPDMTVVSEALVREVPENVFGGRMDFINLVLALFECINARVRFLYDEDHQLGHSFFMGATSYKELREVMLSRVIPMLQEYFYGSWDRVCTTLGCPYDESGRPARGEGREAFITAEPVSERDLLGFDHGDFEDALTFRISEELVRGESPERLKQMCVDLLSGEYLTNYENKVYLP